MYELVVHALLCCDRIITEDNGKKGLVGVFQSFQFAGMPSPGVSWFIYGSLGSVSRGTHEFSVTVTHGQSSQEVVTRSGEIHVASEREDVELVLPVTCKFNHFGAYVITLEVGDELVASRILRVISSSSSKPVRRSNGASG
ncbi:MAG: hypothetical protein OXC12_09715 [Spirochaetaceae bacterium]|nr:hypothetical protein [Spirochaetaceae bacterium]